MLCGQQRKLIVSRAIPIYKRLEYNINAAFTQFEIGGTHYRYAKLRS